MTRGVGTVVAVVAAVVAAATAATEVVVTTAFAAVAVAVVVATALEAFMIADPLWRGSVPQIVLSGRSPCPRRCDAAYPERDPTLPEE